MLRKIALTILIAAAAPLIYGQVNHQPFGRHSWFGSRDAATQAPATASNCVAEEARADNRDKSVLTVRLKVINGLLMIDRKQSRGGFKPSPLFLCRSRLADGKIERELFAELERIFLKQTPFYKFVLAKMDRNDSRVCPPEAKQVCEGDVDWASFKTSFSAWCRAVGLQENVSLSLLETFILELSRPLADTPIFTFDRESGDSFTIGAGALMLRVADPIGDLMKDSDYKVKAPPAVAGLAGAKFIAPGKERIIKALAPLKGRLWRNKVILAYLDDFFAGSRSGYDRTIIRIRVNKEPEKEIVVPLIPRIARITFYGIEDPNEINLALRQILTDKEFATFRKKLKADANIIQKCPEQQAVADDPEGGGTEREITLSCRFVSYKDLLGEEKAPYLNGDNYEAQKLQMAERGFSLDHNPFDPADTTTSANENPDEEPEETEEVAEDEQSDVVEFIELLVRKPEKEKKKKNDSRNSASISAPSAAAQPAATSNPGAAARPAATSNPGAATQPAQPGAAAATNSSADSDERLKKKRASALCSRDLSNPCLNFIGGEAVYRPGQGMRFFGVYHRHRLVGGDISIRGGNHGGFIVSGEGSWNYLFFNKLNRRLAVQINGGTDSTAARVFSGVATDERRTGGSFRTDLEVSANPTLFSIHFGGQHNTVALARAGAVIAKENLTTFNTGATFVAGSRGVSYRRTLQLEPELSFGPGVAAGRKPFTMFTLSAIYHQYLPRRHDFIISARVETASKDTPLYAQPFLGGENSVRGFRTDDAIGRRQWVLQHEYLFPTPGVKPHDEGLLALLRKKVQLAAFFDVGGIYQTTGSKSGVRFGPGLGGRLQYGNYTLKFDWAYGIGDGALGRGHGRFYFSISREIRRLIRQ